MAKNLNAFGRIVALGGFVALAPAGVMADAASATAKAAQHAGLASNQNAIGMVHTHLHHTLNCLVGPDGDGFDESAGNPCGPDGGAIPQTAAGEMRTKLVEIAAEVSSAIGNDDLAAAKEAAMEIQEMLAADD